MPTQRRNRQRKNRRNSQRRNRKNLQRGGIWPFDSKDDSKDNSDTWFKLPKLPDWLRASSKTVQTGDPVDHSNQHVVQSSDQPIVQPSDNDEYANMQKKLEESGFAGGKQRKSNKKNKKSNKKR